MKIRYLIAILMFSVLSNCNGQIEEIIDAHEMLEEAERVIKSEEFQNEQNRIQTAETTLVELQKEIDNSGSSGIIESKNKVLTICDSLKRIISDSENLLISRHDIDKDGIIKNKSKNINVNNIFIEQKHGEAIKLLFISSENKLMEIVSEQKLDLSNESLPIKLNLFMEKKGQNWENYIFEDMPAMALFPILKKLYNDVQLTELLMIEKLKEKIE